MIDFDTQIKIQAFLDGELPEAEARKIAALIASNAEAAALQTELNHTRQALAVAEEGIKLPETREFYWSKIQRAIERSETVSEPEASPSLWQMLTLVLKPVAVGAVVVLLGYLAFLQFGSSDRSVATNNRPTEVLIASVEADAITFHDHSDDTTYVWFSYPAENGVAKQGGATTLN